MSSDDKQKSSRRSLARKAYDFAKLLALVPVFSFSFPLSLFISTPSVWNFRDEFRPSMPYVWSKFMTEVVMGVNLKLVGTRGLYKAGFRAK